MIALLASRFLQLIGTIYLETYPTDPVFILRNHVLKPSVISLYTAVSLIVTMIYRFQNRYDVNAR